MLVVKWHKHSPDMLHLLLIYKKRMPKSHGVLSAIMDGEMVFCRYKHGRKGIVLTFSHVACFEAEQRILWLKEKALSSPCPCRVL